MRAFQRMLMTTMFVAVAISVFEGAIVSNLLLRGGSKPLSALAGAILGTVIVWRLFKAQNRRIDLYERERHTWRSGAEGERVVAIALDRLSKNFVVFHDFNTARGNFDHLVVGPSGIFAVETKNFRGTITADGEGELMQDGTPSSQPYVKQLVRRIMAVREQVVALTGREVFIQGVMVFPKARVDAKFGTTRNVHCVRDGQLCGYIENEKFDRRLTAEEIDLVTRAFQGIAGMDADFRNAA